MISLTLLSSPDPTDRLDLDRLGLKSLDLGRNQQDPLHMVVVYEQERADDNKIKRDIYMYIYIYTFISRRGRGEGVSLITGVKGSTEVGK